MTPSPEALLAEFTQRMHLGERATDYLLSLLQAARAAGSVAGAQAEREEICKLLCDLCREGAIPATVHHGRQWMHVDPTTRLSCRASDIRNRGNTP